MAVTNNIVILFTILYIINFKYDFNEVYTFFFLLHANIKYIPLSYKNAYWGNTYFPLYLQMLLGEKVKTVVKINRPDACISNNNSILQ